MEATHKKKYIYINRENSFFAPKLDNKLPESIFAIKNFQFFSPKIVEKLSFFFVCLSTRHDLGASKDVINDDCFFLSLESSLIRNFFQPREWYQIEKFYVCFEQIKKKTMQIHFFFCCNSVRYSGYFL